MRPFGLLQLYWLVIALVVDAHKRIYQKVANEYEIRTKTNCKRFSKNLKGTIFYGIPHIGGPKELL
jgi:hypothetical protein